MKRDSASSHLLKGIIFVVFIILFVKLFWIVTEWYLPLESVEVESGKGESGLYYRYRLASEKVKKAPRRVTKPKKRAPTIKELKLIGIYHDSVNDIAVVRKNGKDEVLVAGEKINGFTLKAVGEKEAWFERDGKSYDIVFLDKYLPDGDGDDIAALIKSEWKDTLVISITGDPDSEENLPDIYDMHIPKPFSRKLIQKIVREFQ